MATTTSKLLSEALELPRTDRAELAAQLLRSLDDGEDPPDEMVAAWSAEIERRIDRRTDGLSKSIPIDEAVFDVRAELKAWREARAR